MRRQRDGKLNFGEITFIIKAGRHVEMQIDFAIGSRNLSAALIQPQQQGIIRRDFVARGS